MHARHALWLLTIETANYMYVVKCRGGTCSIPRSFCAGRGYKFNAALLMLFDTRTSHPTCPIKSYVAVFVIFPIRRQGKQIPYL